MHITHASSARRLGVVADDQGSDGWSRPETQHPVSAVTAWHCGLQELVVRTLCFFTKSCATLSSCLASRVCNIGCPRREKKKHELFFNQYQICKTRYYAISGNARLDPDFTCFLSSKTYLRIDLVFFGTQTDFWKKKNTRNTILWYNLIFAEYMHNIWQWFLFSARSIKYRFVCPSLQLVAEVIHFNINKIEFQMKID